MRRTIPALKQHKEKVPKKAACQQPAPTASSSAQRRRHTKKASADSAAVPGGDDVLTFEQKKDPSEAIQNLDGQKLGGVIQIVHEGVPEIRDVPPSYFSKLVVYTQPDRRFPGRCLHYLCLLYEQREKS